MTATERLRAILDDRGVEHYDRFDVTEWVGSDGEICHTDAIYSNRATVLALRKCTTPEQAIAATLGAGTCKLTLYEDTGITVCSECGAVQPDDWTVYYCWSCGRRVVEVDE